MSGPSQQDVYTATEWDDHPGGRPRSKPGQGPNEVVYEHTTDATGRKVVDKPANRAILRGQRQRLEHQAKLAALADSKRATTSRRRSSSSSTRPDKFTFSPHSTPLPLSPTSIFIALLFLPLLSHFLTQTWTFNTSPIWRPYIKQMTVHPWNPFGRTLLDLTPEELSRYDGADERRPVYVGIDGDVYDVSANRRVYGKGGSYNMMAGRDAARSFVTGCFETHLTHDLRGLSPEELKALDHWKSFFATHERYSLVGRVLNPSIPPNTPLPAPCRPVANAAPGADAARAGRDAPDPIKHP